MQINVEMDTRGLTAKTAREEKRLAYNVSTALNETTKTAQANIRAHMMATFQLRASAGKDRKWLLDRIKMTFASPKKGLAYTQVYVDQSKQRLLLAEFEDGGMRRPFVGKNVADPNPAVARLGGSVAGQVDPGLRFTRLGLKQSTTTGGKIQWKGKQRTFLLPHSANLPLGAVMQRVGPGPDDIRVVYSFKSPFKLRRLLDLIQIASTTMRERWPIEWAIANARNPSK
jgi:hypothetical protein